MAIWQIFKVNRKTFFNPKAWLDVDQFKESNRTIVDSVRGLFTTETPERTETFEEAMVRLGLSEHDIDDARQNYQAFTWFFVALGVCVIIFGFYLLFFHHTISGFCLAMSAAALFFGQAYRYSFWHFQIKNKKLGCTFEEWRRGKPDSNTSGGAT